MVEKRNLEIITLKCPTCGGDIVWCGENDIPDGRVENTYRCDRCGTTFTSLEPSEEDKLDDYAAIIGAAMVMIYWNAIEYTMKIA